MEGATYFHEALSVQFKEGTFRIAMLLIERCPNGIIPVDPLTNEHALHLASRAGALDVVTWLLNNGTDVNVLTVDNLNAVHFACMNPNSEISTHAFNCVARKQADIVDLLIEFGANLNQLSTSGDAPLHYASRSGFVDIVTTLLQNNVDVNVQNQDGRAPLHRACEGGHTEVARLLTDNGAHVNVITKMSELPIHSACQSPEDSAGIVVFILAHTTDINCVDIEGVSPLHIASALGHVNKVNLLIRQGANFNLEDDKGKTPLRHILHDIRLNPCNQNRYTIMIQQPIR